MIETEEKELAASSDKKPKARLMRKTGQGSNYP